MSTELQHYKEALNANELGFLIKKESKERKQYVKVFTILMVVSFVVPYIAAWYRVYDGAPNAFSYPKFFTAAGILLAISSFACYFSYRYNLRHLQHDIKYGTKTVSTNHVTRKVHVPLNDTYYFYLDSHIKLSIEVSPADYDFFSEGDEISIEFTTYSREYLGYF